MTESFSARASTVSASVTSPGTSSLVATQTLASGSHSAFTVICFVPIQRKSTLMAFHLSNTRKKGRSRAAGRSVQRVSAVLAALRLGEVVRYESDGKRNRYRLKHPGEVGSLLRALSRFVKAASAVRR